MSTKSLEFKFLALVLGTCLVIGVIAGITLGDMEAAHTMDEYSKLLKLTGSRYDTYFQEMFANKTKTGVRANRVIASLLSDPKAPRSPVAFKRGPDGAYRTADELSGVFLANRSTLTPELTNYTGILQKAWPSIYPFVSKDFQSLYVIMGDGYVCMTPREWPLTVPADHDFSKDNYYPLADPAHNPERAPAWTPVYNDSLDKKWMTTLVVPLYINNRFVGVTATDYDLDSLFVTITGMARVEGWCRAFIFNRRGNIIAHPDYMEAIMKRTPGMNDLLDTKAFGNPGLKDFMEKILKESDKEGEVLTFDYRGITQYACARAISGSPNEWYLVVYTDFGAQKSFIQEMKIKILLAMVALAVILGLAVRVAFRKLVLNRIAELATASDQLGQGKWDTPLPPDSPDELGTLTKAFKVMSGEIQNQVITLEQRVQERTHALAEAEERSRLLLDSAGEGIFGVDTDGNVSFINPAALNLLGFHADEILGKGIHAVIHHTRADGAPYPVEECPMYQAFTSGLSKRVTGEVLWRKDGSSFPVEYTSVPLRMGGRITGAVITFSDVTERRKAEEAILEAKEAADEANRAKSEFLARMSHEIRTPMNAIIGMSHLALQTELTKKQHDYVTKVHQSALSLLGIINDILDFSKIEAGKLDIESVEFDLDDVLEKLSSLTALKAEEKGLELLFTRGPGVPDALVGDPLRLGQILTNLTNNAMKFTEKGEVVVTTEVVERTDRQVTLQFSVRDTGIGLTKEQIGRLFQSFSQADGSTTRKYGGTGLGLAICKRLSELMGGKIWVESVPGSGSSFIFTVVFGLSTTPRAPRLLPLPDLRGTRALVVDDSRIAREILVNALESLQFVVTAVSSGKEALEELEKRAADRPYELVLMDWKMPGMNGIETIKEIKRNSKVSPLPRFVMVTAYGREEIMKDAEDAGITGFLIKPVSNSILFDTIMSVMGHEEQKAGRKERKSGVDRESLKPIEGARVLLVEDNEINQQVAREILEGAGLRVEIAGNGREGVEAVARSEYDIVLMDIQMPEMDGFEATRAIRKSGKEGIDRLPVLAMTANAMAGDRERSLEAGMNDHVTKPIDPDDLFSALLRWIKPGNRGGPVEKQPQDTSAQAIPGIEGVESYEAVRRLGGNARLYRELLWKFVRDNEAAPGQIVEALEKNDRELAQRLAHTVKGTSGNIGATDLYRDAGALESAIAKEEKDATAAALAVFEKSLHDLVEKLRPFAAEQAPGSVTDPAAAGGDAAKLRGLLLELQENAQKQKPKICKDLMSQIASITWPGEYTGDLAILGRMIGTYKFKESQEIMERLLATLKTKGEHDG